MRHTGKSNDENQVKKGLSDRDILYIELCKVCSSTIFAKIYTKDLLTCFRVPYSRRNKAFPDKGACTLVLKVTLALLTCI